MLAKFVKTAAVVLTMAISSIGNTAAWAQTADAGMAGKDTMINSGSTEGGVNAGCPSAEVFSGKMLTNLCWECVFPLVISGVQISAGPSSAPDGIGNAPGLCICPEPNYISSVGIPTSLWEPARMVELVRMSGCSEVLNGTKLPFDKLNQGLDATQMPPHESSKDEPQGSLSKRHYHYYSYPILQLTNAWVPKNCAPMAFMDIDVLYMSEIDPTWNYDEIAFFTHPEVALIASPLGIIACIPDAFLSNLDHPVNLLTWCAGSWGIMFPNTGHTNYVDDNMASTNLMASRVLYQLHRRAMEYRTIGGDAMCGGTLDAFLPKNQYRFSVFHPIAETQSNHVMGKHEFFWGIGRTVPVAGEDPVYLIWRWIDCCSTLK
mgnify:CR=1 FL=1